MKGIPINNNSMLGCIFVAMIPVKVRSTYKIACLCTLAPAHIIIIIMVIFKCYFSGEHIALSINKNNNGVNIALEEKKQIKSTVLDACVNKPNQNMKIKSICRNHWQKRSIMQTSSIR